MTPAGPCETCGGSGVRRALGSQRDAPFRRASPEGHPTTRRFLRVPQTRGPPLTRGSRPFLFLPCRAPPAPPPPRPNPAGVWIP